LKYEKEILLSGKIIAEIIVMLNVTSVSGPQLCLISGSCLCRPMLAGGLVPKFSFYFLFLAI